MSRPISPATTRSAWRDWRTYVGGLGRILVACGLLVLGFVAYQLWGTAIQEARAQNALEDDFADLLQATATTADLAPSTTTTPPPTTAATTTLADPAPPTTAPPTTAPPTTAPPTTVAPPPPAVTVGLGEAVARLEIPRIGVDKIVVSGVRSVDLKKGPGLYPTNPLPGELGNAAIAGHRTTYGSPFSDLDKLAPGDEIVATTPAGRYVYRVAASQITSPNAGDVVAPTADARLTLITCHPRFSTSQRLIVKATLDPVSSSPLRDPGSTLVVDPTDTPADEPVATTGSGGATTSIAGAPPTTADTSGEAAAVEAAADDLSDGWLSDPDAWPAVALWGGALTLIALASWRLSRRVGRNWVGALIGIVPFVVVLYFFYENVTRLLPPSL